MAALRPSAVLLIRCALLASASYYHRQDVVFYTDPVAELPAAARLNCAFLCDDHTGCLGFIHSAEGVCQLFDSQPRVAPDPSVVPVTYIRGTPVSPCRPGWLVFGQKCFFRYLSEEARYNFVDHRQRCQRFGGRSDLAVPRDVQERSWLTYHSSRSDEAEYTGLWLENGVFHDLDGNQVSIEMQLPQTVQDPGYIILKKFQDVMFLTRLSGATMLGSVCEAPGKSCSHGTRCPYNWFTMDDFCYLYVSSTMSWQSADDHCRGLQPGARLSPFTNMETFRVLHYGIPTSEDIWAGMSDSEEEGNWKSVDNSPSSVTWYPGEPNGGTTENCAFLMPDGMADWPCSEENEFVCRLPAAVCGE